MLLKLRVQLCKMIMGLGKNDFPHRRELIRKIEELHRFVAEIQQEHDVR